MDLDQARVIVAAVDRLPETLEAAGRERAEKHLVHPAGEHDATTLRMLGRRVFEVIDPDTADQQEGRRLAAEEAVAARAAYLQLVDNGDGSHTGRFQIPTLHAAMHTKALHALTAPGQPGFREPAAERTGRPRPSRPEPLGESLWEAGIIPAVHRRMLDGPSMCSTSAAAAGSTRRPNASR